MEMEFVNSHDTCKKIWIIQNAGGHRILVCSSSSPKSWWPCYSRTLHRTVSCRLLRYADTILPHPSTNIVFFDRWTVPKILSCKLSRGTDIVRKCDLLFTGLRTLHTSADTWWIRRSRVATTEICLVMVEKLSNPLTAMPACENWSFLRVWLYMWGSISPGRSF